MFSILRKCNLNTHTKITQINAQKLRCFSSHFDNCTAMPNKEHDIEVEEIRIKLPWGHLAAKWWGPKTVRPIIAAHGWQDNAGTFDTLIPLLPKSNSYLAIDLPGHGMSSHIPVGLHYSTFDLMTIFHILMREYKWDKISLMGHSLSSILAFYYTASFPESVDMFVSLDVLKPAVTPVHKLANDIRKRVNIFTAYNERILNKSEPPAYLYDDMVERLYAGTHQSVSKEAAPYLLYRAIEQSKADPNKYFFTRDNRLKAYNYAIPHHQLHLELAKRIVAPHLFFKATIGPLHEDVKYYDETLALLQQTNPKFQHFVVEGTHHVHLNEPTKISNELSEFIKKYRPT